MLSSNGIYHVIRGDAFGFLRHTVLPLSLLYLSDYGVVSL